MKLQKKLKNKVTGKALALLAPAHLLNRLDWKSDLHGAGHFGTLEICSDVIELKATVEGSYHHELPWIACQQVRRLVSEARSPAPGYAVWLPAAVGP